MSEVFVLCDYYEGAASRIFSSRDAAKDARRALRNKLHTAYCIDKRVPDKCSCGTPRVVECTAHYYARTVTPHSVQDCTIAADVVIEVMTVE